MDFAVAGNWVNFEYELYKVAPEKVAQEFIDQTTMGNDSFDIIKNNIQSILDKHMSR